MEYNQIPKTGTIGGMVDNINANFQLTKEMLERLEVTKDHAVGLFSTLATLQAAYPTPEVGDWALVGDTTPFAIYKCTTAGTWSDTGGTYDGGTIDLSDYVKQDKAIALENGIRLNAAKNYPVTITGGYINKANGQVATADGCVYSDFIPCLPGQQWYCRLRANSSLGLCFYDSGKNFIAGSGVNVAEGDVVTVPSNAYFLRGSSRVVTNLYPFVSLVTDETSLQDVKKYISPVWVKYADNSDAAIDTTFAEGHSRRDVYNIVKSIRLYGFDATKKHTLYICNGLNAFSFRISEYNGSAWIVAYQYTQSIIPSNDYGFDATVSGKRVVAELDFSKVRLNGSVINALTATPEYVFAKTCYFELPEEEEPYTAGEGIDITNKVVSINPDTMPVPSVVMDGESEMYNVTSDDFTIQGFINKANGLVNTHQSYKCTDFFPVKPGQQYYTTCRALSSACIGFYDSSKVFQPSSALNISANIVYTVPDGCYYVRYSDSSGNGSATLQNPEYRGLKELTEGLAQVQSGQKPMNSHIKLFPKTKLPCISFQFDDNNIADEPVYELFKSYGKTCAFAFIGSEANVNGHAERYLRYQADGFQIMNHSINGNVLNTTNFTYATAMAAIFGARKNIQGAGMICNGFVCPSSNIDASFKPILALAHAYAFTTATSSTTGNGRDADPCDLHRHTLQSSETLAQLEAWIDSCITNDQIITLYGHSYDLVDGGTVDQFSIARLTALIEYCIAKEQEGKLFFGGTDECVKYYFDL